RELPGINTAYWYISTCYGTPANLHIEDGKTGSVNLLVKGAPKDWLFILPGSKDKLENALREEFSSTKPCSQFARHLDILLAPSWLRQRRIPFSVVRQYPGEMIVTFQDAYHQVMNCGPNFAVAINFELGQWPE
ncbi:transcription factor jumonji, partial [Trematosphaeria pertusa]